MILAACVIQEAAYLINKYLGARAEIALINAMASGDFVIEELQTRDYSRAAVLMAQHERLDIGFVDAANMAVCERLKLADLATTDRRHFTAIRPSHRAKLNLLPNA
ncbi:MAG: VapC toxin family PIN domain ribonuclease [Betaproteobacteria bacterium]|nr:VapC toxin family PIN domain ribonuclease [Betaproteobacteria bacterium]